MKTRILNGYGFMNLSSSTNMILKANSYSTNNFNYKSITSATYDKSLYNLVKFSTDGGNTFKSLINTNGKIYLNRGETYTIINEFVPNAVNDTKRIRYISTTIFT